MSKRSEQSPGSPVGANRSGADAWLARPETIRLLWRVFAVVLALSVAVQLLVKVKGYFSVDGWFGFGAVYGFGACFAMVVFAKLLGRFLKRGETYYGADEDV